MPPKQIRRIRFPQDPNPELEKHPMSLVSEGHKTRSGGGPPWTGFYVSRIPSGFSFEAHRMLEELRIRILVTFDVGNRPDRAKFGATCQRLGLNVV